ncbi:MAG TPA: hypothetical protein PLR99_09715 [Polyangiaceae bacterium]|jgi:hypothetical protein|nr:hypothetical protein [Polyangiaceae bacterium]
MNQSPRSGERDPAERPTRRVPRPAVVEETPVPPSANLPSFGDGLAPPPPSSGPAPSLSTPSDDKALVFAVLEERGWAWRDGALYAPNETLWLEREAPWNGHVRAFRERVAARATRIMMTDVRGDAERAIEAERALADTLSLVAVLDTLFVTLALREGARERLRARTLV